MNLSTLILISLAVGAAAGLFFGELVAPIKIVGDGFILLLQMTVLPYVSISLISGLGSLKAEGATRLAVRAGAAMLALWAAALVAVVVFPLSFPDWKSASFFSTSLTRNDGGFDFLSLFIPANPFASYAQSIVPSVVVFSVSIGIALIGMEEKTTLLRSLDTLRDAFSRITNGVIRLAPIGIFAIAAYAGGTLSVDEAASLQIYMLVFALSAIILAMWTIPALVTTLTPYTWSEVMTAMRGIIVTAFATGSVFVVLSLLSERAKELVRKHSADPESDDNVVDVVIPVAYTFPSAGKLLSIAFVLFAGWISGYALAPSQYPTLLVGGLSTYFGSTVVAIPFLLDLFQIPSDTFQLFLVADNVVGGRFGAMVAVMHLIALSLISVAAMAGQVRFDPLRFARFLVITAVLMVTPVLGVRMAFEALGHEYEGYDRFVSMKALLPAADIAPQRPDPTSTEAGAPSATTRSSMVPEDLSRRTVDRIRERRVLRVGYVPDRLPWAFRNSQGEVVGFDIEMAHTLARELDVALDLSLVPADGVAAALDRGEIDLCMSGYALTTPRLEEMDFSPPYIDETVAFVTRDHRRADFSSRSAVKALVEPHIAAPNSPYYIEKLKRYIPSAKVTIIDSPRVFFRAEKGVFDAMIFTAESGSAFSLVYPAFTVAVPQPDILKAPLAYPVRKGDDDMVAFLAAWIELKKRDRTIERLFDHWILGEAAQTTGKRWSVIRDVLGWVD